ncbi:MAG: DUF4384 domain-containing protein [Thermodesulfovibrionales bacterium]
MFRDIKDSEIFTRLADFFGKKSEVLLVFLFGSAASRKMTEYLTKVMGYPEENVVTLLNEHATNVDFAKYFEKWLPNNVEKDRNLYKVKLKALVEPVYPEKSETISLKVSLSKTVLKEGDEVKVFFQTNRDSYVYIFSVAADGSVTLLLPNSINKDNLILAGRAYTFPTPESRIRLTAMFLPEFKGKIAEEKIKIITTKKKEDLVPLGFQEGMFKVYDAKSTGMISDLIKRLNQLEPADWAEATTVYRIERR